MASWCELTMVEAVTGDGNWSCFINSGQAAGNGIHVPLTSGEGLTRWRFLFSSELYGLVGVYCLRMDWPTERTRRRANG